jgi:DNA-binding Xre family transcriptional regulator
MVNTRDLKSLGFGFAGSSPATRTKHETSYYGEVALSPAKLIRDMRREKKLSQEHLAHEAGVHVNTVSRMEAGKDVKLSVFERVADALGCEVELLPKETTNEQNEITHDEETV